MTGAAMRLDGKRVVVIGGASGIGFAVAALARELGATVVIASSNAANVGAAVERLAGSEGQVVDLRIEASVARLFEAQGGFDHLAVTAGDWDRSALVATRDLDLAAARDVFAVRLFGALAAVKHASRSIAPGGSVTLTGGMLAHRPRKGAALATAVAGAVEFLTRGLAVDLAPVRVNAVCPGLVLTERTVQMLPREMIAGSVARLPVPRAAAPEEAAMAYVQLMLNGYVTGQIVAVDGGGGLV